MKSKVIILCLIFVILLTSIVFATYKPSIHTASLEQLTAIRGIGDILATRVSLYLTSNSDCSIDDLDCIEGMGEYRLELIKRHFR